MADPVWDDQIATVLERLSNGESLRTIAKDANMPKPSTFVLWCNLDPVLAEHYARAREAGMDQIGEEIIEIADQATPETAARDRLRFDARRWYLSKLASKKYGDKLAIGGDADSPLQININKPGA